MSSVVSAVPLLQNALILVQYHQRTTFAFLITVLIPDRLFSALSTSASSVTLFANLTGLESLLNVWKCDFSMKMGQDDNLVVTGEGLGEGTARHPPVII
ncbi:hypothetical protein ADUPG1_011403 [Aduncisulcus paluster]|uniref:Uncharacterized protein n=1 Tax=Aduncisulcus paluster TaxID=2918883 RepID=A0ABQ5JVH5_9EUKA|nr:hypothetical protein ADUPG1_011403 [Aduncisulcus paluster]